MQDSYYLLDKELNPSSNTEIVLLTLGITLYDALVNAERVDEVEALYDIALTYSFTLEYYGEKTGRFNGSFGTNLDEAILFKLDSLKKKSNDTKWRHWADTFKKELQNTFENKIG